MGSHLGFLRKGPKGGWTPVVSYYLVSHNLILEEYSCVTANKVVFHSCLRLNNDETWKKMFDTFDAIKMRPRLSFSDDEVSLFEFHLVHAFDQLLDLRGLQIAEKIIVLYGFTNYFFRSENSKDIFQNSLEIAKIYFNNSSYDNSLK